MPVRTILEYPDPMLAEICTPVAETAEPGLDGLIDDLIDTLDAHQAIGLSAPQLGDLRRVSVVRTEAAPDAPLVLINPEIVKKHCAFGLIQESCLSLPGVKATVMRDTRVRVRALDRAGAPFERELAGMDAVCLQHERDHLDGRLFLDKVPAVRRFFIRRRLQAQHRRATAAGLATA